MSSKGNDNHLSGDPKSIKAIRITIIRVNVTIKVFRDGERKREKQRNKTIRNQPHLQERSERNFKCAWKKSLKIPQMKNQIVAPFPTGGFWCVGMKVEESKLNEICCVVRLARGCGKAQDAVEYSKYGPHKRGKHRLCGPMACPLESRPTFR